MESLSAVLACLALHLNAQRQNKPLGSSTHLQHHKVGVAQRQLRLLGRQAQRKLLLGTHSGKQVSRMAAPLIEWEA